ncbi:N-acetyltransferase family protein [Aquihabitans sp. McL0605]|uniref:GNAT family N-acetyltransferase n=1 Tax=Aquihabitans sp. McL0605 TaxID=3415671 RepID=UPI003CEB5B73
MLIRPTDDGDAEVVLRLRLAFIAEFREIEVAELTSAFVDATRAYLADVTARDRLRSWVAEADGEPVGLVSVLTQDAPPLPEELRAHEGYIVNMYVAPSARKQGIARQLLAATTGAARAEGWRRLYLYATDAGRPLYEHTGFAPDDRWMDLRLP